MNLLCHVAYIRFYTLVHFHRPTDIIQCFNTINKTFILVKFLIRNNEPEIFRKLASNYSYEPNRPKPCCKSSTSKYFSSKQENRILNCLANRSLLFGWKKNTAANYSSEIKDPTEIDKRIDIYIVFSLCENHFYHLPYLTSLNNEKKSVSSNLHSSLGFTCWGFGLIIYVINCLQIFNKYW